MKKKLYFVMAQEIATDKVFDLFETKEFESEAEAYTWVFTSFAFIDKDYIEFHLMMIDEKHGGAEDLGIMRPTKAQVERKED